MQWYVSRDAFGSSDDLLLRQTNGASSYGHAAIAANATYGPDFTVSLALPTALPAGWSGQNFYVVMKTDSANHVAESNEANNFGQIRNGYDRDPIIIRTRAPIDFNGDGRSDIGVYEPNASGARWVVRYNCRNGVFGQNGHDIDVRNIGGFASTPIVGDFNGDGLADIGVYEPNASGPRWVVRYNCGAGVFGQNGHDIDVRNIGGFASKPIVGDFNGDGLADIGVPRGCCNRSSTPSIFSLAA